MQSHHHYKYTTMKEFLPDSFLISMPPLFNNERLPRVDRICLQVQKTYFFLHLLFYLFFLFSKSFLNTHFFYYIISFYFALFYFISPLFSNSMSRTKEPNQKLKANCKMTKSSCSLRVFYMRCNVHEKRRFKRILLNVKK